MKANKLVTVFLMCMIVLSVVHVSMAGCFDSCVNECMQNGRGKDICENNICDPICPDERSKEQTNNLEP
ncbi:hypothetical protein P3L10_010794 [Capsicum annuum]